MNDNNTVGRISSTLILIARNGFPKRFNFFEDPGQGWLEVPYSCITSMNLQSEITSFSYQNEDKVYLEEDLDAPVFINAYLKLINRAKDYQYFRSITNRVYHEHTPIRQYRHYVPATP